MTLMRLFLGFQPLGVVRFVQEDQMNHECRLPVNHLREMLEKGGDSRRQALAELHGWIYNTCILFGALESTAYKVAGLFVSHIADGYEKAVE